MAVRAKRSRPETDLTQDNDPTGLLALEAEESRGSVMWSIATWAGSALLMIALVILTARTDQGRDRLAMLADGRAFRTDTPVEKVAATDPMLTYETRRLAEAVRVMGSERDQLASRLETLERSVGDVTASINRSGSAETGRRELRAVDQRMSAVESAPLEPTDSRAADSQVMKTEFGIDLAGDTSIDALRARWNQLRAQHSVVLDGLRPVVAIREGRQPGSVELRLVAGPLSNANTAARLCATLSSAGLECKSAVFDGQRLAIR